jgi:NhaP-type Na+/H+ or K+/H+ antiporter
VTVGDAVFTTVVLTVSLSIVLHGASAKPLAEAFAHWAEATPCQR